MPETITDAILKRQLKISRFIVGMISRVQGKLDASDKELFSLIRTFTDSASAKDLSSIRKAGYGSSAGRGLIDDIFQLLEGQALTLADTIEQESRQLAESEAAFLAGALKSDPVRLNDSLLTVKGNKISDMVSGLIVRYRGRLMEALANSFAMGTDPVKAIKGTRPANYRDGIIVKRNNDVASVTDYSAAGVIMNTRDAAYVDGKVRRVDWLATLDLRACSICINNEAGSPYDIDKAPEIGHPRCRCVKIPHYETKTSRPFVRDDRPVKEIPKSERKDKIGQTTKGFKEWFGSLPGEDKRKWLGKGRYDLYKQDRLTLADLTTGDGRIVTLKELEE